MLLSGGDRRRHPAAHSRRCLAQDLLSGSQKSDQVDSNPRPRAACLTHRGPVGHSVFTLAYATLPPRSIADIFLIVPKLHHNTAVPNWGFCNWLVGKDLVGARGFEPRASCAQGRRAPRAVIKS